MAIKGVAKGPARDSLQGGAYLLPVVLGVVGGGLARFVAGTEPVFKGQSFAILLPLLGLAASIPLWLVFRSRHRMPALQSVAFCSLLGIWIVATVRTVTQHTGFNYLISMIPVVIVMVLIKPPTSRDALLAARVLGLAVVVAALAAEVFSFATGTLVLVDPEFVYTTLGEMAGTTKRWVGPFLQENYAGPISAFVFVFALTQRGWYRWVIGLSSAWMVLGSTSSTAVFGVITGGLSLGVFVSAGPLTRFSRQLRGFVAIIGFAFVAIVVSLRDLTFNGRATVWSSYLDVWEANPLGGVGTSGIESALSSGQIPLYWTHAHNVPLDLLVRHGLLGFLLILLAYTLSTWGAFRAALGGVSWPLAIVLMFMIMGILEVPGDWLTWNIPMIWLALALLGAQDPSRFSVGATPTSRSSGDAR